MRKTTAVYIRPDMYSPHYKQDDKAADRLVPGKSIL